MTALHLVVVEPFERLGHAFPLGARIEEPSLVAAIAAGDHGRHVVAVAAPDPASDTIEP